MPGLGPAAAFLEGWNEADDAEKDFRLEKMRTLAGAATSATTARATQATTRREEQLFPELYKGEQLKNIEAGIANLQAREDLRMSKATAPYKIRQEKTELDQTILDYQKGLISHEELKNQILREESARRRFEAETGRTTEFFGQYQQAAPGMQTQAAYQQDLFGLGAINKALQSKYNNQIMQLKINQGLAPQQAQAEVLTIVNQSNLLAAQAYAAIQKPYLTAMSKAGTDRKLQIDAKRKAINDTIVLIGKVETDMATLEGKVTLQGAIDSGLDPVVITMLNPSIDDKSSAMGKLDNYRNALINMLYYNHGANYYALIKEAPESQKLTPGLSSEALLYSRQLDQMQRGILPTISQYNPSELQIPGMSEIPGLINLPGVSGTPTEIPAPIEPGTETPEPQGWGGFDVNAILEAYGNLGGGNQ